MDIPCCSRCGKELTSKTYHKAFTYEVENEYIHQRLGEYSLCDECYRLFKFWMGFITVS